MRDLRSQYEWDQFWLWVGFLPAIIAFVICWPVYLLYQAARRALTGGSDV